MLILHKLNFINSHLFYELDETTKNALQLYIQIKGHPMKQAINIRLEKDLVQSLDEYAQELDKTRTSLVEKAIEMYFDTLDEMVADKRIDNLKSGKSTIVSMEDVFKKAGIDV